MSDDKTQEMPVMADAGDMPTETLDRKSVV